ncbi:MAG TPA: hypothetical protein VH482_17575 [Thermomicrobiales bacterium]|jgi:hypothetical protein
MRPYSSLGLNSFRPHHDDVVQAFRDRRFAAPQYLAAEGRRLGFIAEAERARLVRQAGCRPAGIAAMLVAVRQTMGTALVRLGVRLTVPAPTRGAVPVVGGPEPRR